jgi:hypothetical protein
MTRPKPSRYTVNSFAPELLETLLKGSCERVEIPCPDQRTMQHIQMRLNMLRGAMFRERHQNHSLVTRARMTRTWDKSDKNKDCVLVIQPHDTQFVDIFRRAGIEVHQPTANILDDLDAEPKAPEPSSPLDPYQKWKKLI